MVKALYSQSDDGIYTGLRVRGHAGFADSGKDLICAGVSCILFGLMNALDQFEDVEIKESEDDITIHLRSDSPVIQNYMDLVLVQLKTIEESYGGYLKVERKKSI